MSIDDRLPMLNRIRDPVRREGAERYVLLTAIGFATSVLGVRLFLQLTGYPQLGNGTLHIAHVLWGGLFLFIASLLPLLFANRWVYSIGAILSGIGVGLFIDEVGKFITQTNDYFFPAAAPIIYACFLMVIMLYLRMKRPPSLDPRAEFYHVLDSLQEILDHDLEPDELAELKEHLTYLRKQRGNADYTRLAAGLLTYLDSKGINVVPTRSTLMEQWSHRLSVWQQKILKKNPLRIALMVSFVFLGLGSFIELIVLIAAPSQSILLVRTMLSEENVSTHIGTSWFVTRIVFEGIAGAFYTVSALLFALRQDRKAVAAGYYGLIMSLTVVNILIFYLAQFKAVAATMSQLILLLGLLHYRHYFLPRREAMNTAAKKRSRFLPWK